MQKILSVIIWLLPGLIAAQAYQKYNMSLQSRITGQPGTNLTDVWGYELDGNEFAIVGSRGATNIYNVNDCTNPTLDTAIVDGFNSAWRDYKVYGGYAYAVCDGADCGLQVIKISPDVPETPGEQYVLTTDSSLIRAHNIFIDGANARLYAVGARISPNGTTNNILIYDVGADPSNPLLLKIFDPGKYTHDIYVENNIGFCSHGWASQVGIYDFTDVDNIISVGSSSPASGYNHSGWKHPYEDVFYVAEEVPIGQPLFVYDISDLTAPQWSEVNSFKEPLESAGNNRPHNPFVHGDLLYVSYYHDGLQIWDVTDPYQPIRVAYFDTYYQNDGVGYANYNGAWGTYPYLSSGCILVSDIDNGFFTLKMDTHPLTTNISNGDIYFEEAGAGIVFKNNDGEYYKMYSSGGFLFFADASPPSGNDVQLKESHFTFGQNTGIIFKDALNGLLYRFIIVGGSPFFFNIQSLDDKSLMRVVQGDMYLLRKNAGLIFNSLGSCYKIYTDHSGNMRNVTTPCPPD